MYLESSLAKNSGSRKGKDQGLLASNKTESRDTAEDTGGLFHPIHLLTFSPVESDTEAGNSMIFDSFQSWVYWHYKY